MHWVCLITHYGAAKGKQRRLTFCWLLLAKVRQATCIQEEITNPPNPTTGHVILSDHKGSYCCLTARSKDRFSRSKSSLSHPVHTDVTSSSY